MRMLIAAFRPAVIGLWELRTPDHIVILVNPNEILVTALSNRFEQHDLIRGVRTGH